VELPSGVTAPPVSTDYGLGQIAAWSQGEKEVVSIIARSPPTDDEQWIMSFFEQILRARAGQRSASPSAARARSAAERRGSCSTQRRAPG
jgi:hypothetical protein